MTETLKLVRELVAEADVVISARGYDELANDDIGVNEVLAGCAMSVVVEDYPKGPRVLVRQEDAKGRHIHALWGIALGQARPVVLVTAYQPDPERRSGGFLRRQR